MLLFVDMDGAVADFDRHHETVAGYRSDKLLDNADWAAVAAYERMEDMPVLSGSGSRDAYPSCLTSKDLRHRGWHVREVSSSGFLPDEIITARVTALADVCGAAAVYRAVDAQVDWLGSPLAGRLRLHRQLALRPYRPSNL
jgi:hypothetical protein